MGQRAPNPGRESETAAAAFHVEPAALKKTGTPSLRTPGQADYAALANESPRVRQLRALAGRMNAPARGPGPVTQLLTEHDDYKWSEQDNFATDGGTSLAAEEDELPDLAGVTWSGNGTAEYTDEADDTVSLTLYRPRWTEGNALVSVPKDCITTAELVAAWLTERDPEVVGQVNVAPTINVANARTTVNPGDILFHTHSAAAGNFHGAAVIAKDGDDAITMEADSSAGANIASMAPGFDMYEGHAGFRESQGDHDGERTYVIKFANPAGRSDEVTLWEGIQEVIDARRYTTAGEAAAENIKAAIQDGINGMNTDDD